MHVIYDNPQTTAWLIKMEISGPPKILFKWNNTLTLGFIRLNKRDKMLSLVFRSAVSTE